MPGRTYDQWNIGDRIDHADTLTVTQEDNEAFCRLTRNTQILHLDAEAARLAGFRDALVNGLYTFSASVGMTVADTTAGTLIANLGYEDVRHPAPVYPGDVLHVATEVIAMRPSSKPGRGIVTFEHTVSNQAGDVVCQYKRAALLRSDA